MNQIRSTSALLMKLRELMKNTQVVPEAVNAYIITSNDAHQSEYLAECDQRRAFITGFTGSFGTAVVTEKEACLWTDGRYFLQAGREMDENWTLMKEGVPSTPTSEVWLSKHLPTGSKVGVDPSLIPFDTFKSLQTQLTNNGHSLVPISVNLIDLLWKDKPATPTALIQPLPIKYSGKSCKDKVDLVRKEMKEKNASALIFTALDEVAWLLNLRGSDIVYNPVFFAYVITTYDRVYLFVDEKKVTNQVKKHFDQEGLHVDVQPYTNIVTQLQDIISETDDKIWINYGSSYWIHSFVPDKRRLAEITPVALMKAVKNETEIDGLKNCHIRDAAALCGYFAWLEKNVNKEYISEISGVNKLEDFRRQQQDYMGPSFDTISSSGANGSIIHYKPEPSTDRQITSRELYLCDSGGQYLDGTTDVTRTLHFGTPTEYERECFTRVLKGQIFLATSVFPRRIKGNRLDTLARKYLWDVGLEYMHGTGHGIGHYLNVHEGPMGITWRSCPDDPGLEEGMFLSNEPGFYEDEKFGIRLENIVRVIPAVTKYKYNEMVFLTFETVTLVPIQTKMMVTAMMTPEEINYMNEYHKECREKVGPLLKSMGLTEAWEWLDRETQPIVV